MPRSSQDKLDISSLPPGLRAFPRSLPSWMSQEHPPLKVARWHPALALQPPQLTRFCADEQWFCSESPPDDWAFHHISEGGPSNPASKTHFSRSDLVLLVITIAEGGEVRSLDTLVKNSSKCGHYRGAAVSTLASFQHYYAELYVLSIPRRFSSAATIKPGSHESHKA